MAIHELGDMTWEEARDRDRARTVAILPVGAIEAHGPHLPLSADVIIAGAMARAGALALVSRGVPALILPPLPFTAASFAAGFSGTISIGGETVTSLLLDLTRELTRQGFRALAVANAHLDPAHLSSIAAAEPGPFGSPTSSRAAPAMPGATRARSCSRNGPISFARGSSAGSRLTRCPFPRPSARG
jgi:creatinine amidohydrolase